MLSLTRREGKTIVIGDNIRVTILEASGKQVKLGIEAPNDLNILRDEIVLRELAEHKYILVGDT